MSFPASTSVIVLAGGKSERMGHDKAQVKVNGIRLFDATLANIPPQCEVVAVSPVELGFHPRVCESPAYGGPVAGIAAALPWCTGQLVGIMAVDAPAAPLLLPRMAALLAEHAVDAVVVSDGTHRNALCSLWHAQALRQALARLDRTRDIAAKKLLDHAKVYALQGGGLEQDYDTPEQLRRLGNISF
ncbi:molybdenum cofactor guanylyltransferase [Corynebacterium pelargi]|uniref:Molybdopterin-guanine dinucleotide biosynthesis protein MobA n=1 Tax=Corynebacterium pelargi TaxID=1471400 RepID=A0A410W9G3_9CORY|nr:NTP transferase domain-containing protein [Corynebacterium pelargi]QAU52591.1 molybdopterin-guanine dinucleotide biosynthesis protein MobA [Corynebacterium pelargi]GGG77508.1 molybdenum cofactor guanylyltransferase [Corynebacterium pelargi]